MRAPCQQAVLRQPLAQLVAQVSFVDRVVVIQDQVSRSWLVPAAVVVAGRPRGLAQFVTDRMRKFCEGHETWKAWKPDGNGVYLFPIAAAKKWLHEGGLQMIAQKAAEGMARKGRPHQGVLRLVRD